MPTGEGWRNLPDVAEQHHALAGSAAAGKATATLSRTALTDSVGIWEWDQRDHRLIYDSSFLHILGLPDDVDLTLGQVLKLAHPEDRERAVRAAKEGFSHEGLELRMIRPDGETRQVVVHSTGIGHDHDDRVAGVFIDLTDTVEARSRVIDTLESMIDGYIALNRDWGITYVNARAEQLLMMDRRNVLGQNFWETFPDAEGTSFDLYRNAMDHAEAVHFEEYYAPLRGWYEVRAYPMAGGIGIYFHDVTARHEAEAELERLLATEQQARKAAEMAKKALAYQASHDSLTDLFNRGELIDRLERSLGKHENVTILFIDIDRFKLVNDSLGHAAGDRMLEILAHRLGRLAGEGRVVARLGGDEFVIGLVGNFRADADAVAERVLGAIREPVRFDDHELHTTASIGISTSTPGSTASVLLRDADVALYRAKDGGGDGWSWFDEEARQELLAKVEIEHGLRRALDERQLQLQYQPAFDLATGEPTNTEALLRWEHPLQGRVPPDRFIPIAEECGLIMPIGAWVLRQALSEAAVWLGGGSSASGAAANGNGSPGQTVWVNVSIRQLTRPGLAKMITRELERTGLRADQLGIEVTEWAFADRSEVVYELKQIADLGVRIAIDDFGTGYSSISRLSDLPVDVLKIDQDFIQKLGRDGSSETVKAIVDLGHALECVVIAEGVETTEQLEALRETGCDQAGGYLLARPVPSAEVEEVMRAGSQVLRRTA